MDKTVPAGAALLLDFIGGIEAPRGYDVIYGNNQDSCQAQSTPDRQLANWSVHDALSLSVSNRRHRADTSSCAPRCKALPVKPSLQYPAV